MDPATLTRESQQTHLALVRAQLDNIDSMKQDVESQGEVLEAYDLGSSVDRLRLLSLKLADAHTALRQVFDSIARPLLRPLKIHDLPDELLMDIAGYLRNRADIKSLRLSSHRLNETSSHLLMDTVYVSLNPKSLERLSEVSHHATIPRGIRRLVASVDVYNADTARSVQSFAARGIQELDELYQNMGPNHRYRTHTVRIKRSWIAFIETITDTYNDGAHLNEADISALYNGWLRYHQLYHEQHMVLLRGRFPQAIASAIDRMPCVKDLVIRDGSRSSVDEEARSSTFHKLEKLVQNPTPLVEEMMLHTFSWQKARTTGVEDPPTQLLYQIPLAIHDAGHSVAHLRFDLTPPHSFQVQLTSVQMSRLILFAQGLKSFKFSARAEPATLPRPSRDAEEKENLNFFLTAFMKPMHLDWVALDFAFEERDCLAANRTHDPNRTSIGPLLANLHQPQNIHLKNCSITLKELRTFVRLPRKEPAALGLWYVYLLDGDWADAVELLRSEVRRGGLSQHSVSNFVTLFPFSLCILHPILALSSLLGPKVLWLGLTCDTSYKKIGLYPAPFLVTYF